MPSPYRDDKEAARLTRLALQRAFDYWAGHHVEPNRKGIQQTWRHSRATSSQGPPGVEEVSLEDSFRPTTRRSELTAYLFI